MNLLSICPQRVAATAQRIMRGRYEPMVWRDSIDAIAIETGTAATVEQGAVRSMRAPVVSASPRKDSR